MKALLRRGKRGPARRFVLIVEHGLAPLGAAKTLDSAITAAVSRFAGKAHKIDAIEFNAFAWNYEAHMDIQLIDGGRVCLALNVEWGIMKIVISRFGKTSGNFAVQFRQLLLAELSLVLL